MTVVALFPHHERPEASRLAKASIHRLEDLGHHVRVPASDAGPTGLDAWAVDDERIPDALDLAVSIGGDGTMLRTLHAVGPFGVPVLGVNVGHLGYLTEIEPVGLDAALDRFIAGEHDIEERLTIEVRVEHAADRTSTPISHAINEAVVRSSGSHVVRLELSIGGERFTTYAADALLVATPTGSTAYNLSARGPIVTPGLQAFIVTPVAAHQLFDRSLVLEAKAEIRVELLDWRPGRLQVDGADAAVLQPGDAAVCSRGEWSARIVTFESRGAGRFRGILRQKFGLSDR